MKVALYPFNDGSLRNPNGTIYDKPASVIIRESGRNTGNYVHFEAFVEWIKGAYPEVELYDLNVVLERSLHVDYVIILLANGLRIGVEDYCALIAKRLATLKQPVQVILFSIGANYHVTRVTYKLAEGHLALLRLVLQSDYPIYARGDYTVRVLKDNGIERSKVIGCCSILYNSDLTLGSQLQAKFAALQDKLPTKIIFADIGIPKLTQKIHTLAKKYNSYIIHQDDQDLLALVAAPTVTDELTKGIEQLYQRYTEIFPTLDEFVDFCRKNTKYFISLRLWRTFLREEAEFFLGPRIHGTIMAITAGVPAVCICVDSRTLELCQYLQLPYIWHEDFVKLKDPVPEVLQSVKFNAVAFEAARAKIRADMPILT